MKHDIAIWNLSQYLDADFTRAQNHQLKTQFGKISAQPHTIVKQICFPNGNVLF